MANRPTVSFRVDENIKREATKLFETLGMDMSTAINIFFRQAIREQRIPFPVSKNPESTFPVYIEKEKVTDSENS